MPVSGWSNPQNAVSLRIITSISSHTRSPFSHSPFPSSPCHLRYAKGALNHLVGLLCEVLLKQDEDQTDDDWYVSQAAAVALTSVTSCCGAEVLPHVMPFVSANIGAAGPAEWRKREAAVMAFGCVLNDEATQEQVAALIATVDDDGSGEIGFEEFLRMLEAGGENVRLGCIPLTRGGGGNARA